MNKYPDIPDTKAVLATLAKLGRTEFKRSDIRVAATGHPKPKYSGGLGYVTPVAQQLQDLNWIERTARDRYRITERGWRAISAAMEMSSIDHLIAAWNERRALLARQLDMLKRGAMRSGTNKPDSTTEQDIKRVKSWIAELDALLAKHSR